MMNTEIELPEIRDSDSEKEAQEREAFVMDFQKELQRLKTDPEVAEVIEKLSPQHLEEIEQQSNAVWEVLQKEAKFPTKLVVVMVLILILTTVVSLLKGSSKGPSVVGIHVCSVGYWLFTWVLVAVLGGIAAFIGYLLKKGDARRAAMPWYPLQKGDVRWTNKQLAKISGVSVVAGILASLLGIGGGMVLSPLMLALGVLPDVTSATSTFMILFTSLSSVTQYMALGTLKYDYAALYVLTGLLSSLVGQKGTDKLVKRFGKKSFIIFAIAIVLGVSTCLMVSSGIISFVNDIKTGGKTGFNSPCG